MLPVWRTPAHKNLRRCSVFAKIISGAVQGSCIGHFHPLHFSFMENRRRMETPLVALMQLPRFISVITPLDRLKEWTVLGRVARVGDKITQGWGWAFLRVGSYILHACNLLVLFLPELPWLTVGKTGCIAEVICVRPIPLLTLTRPLIRSAELGRADSSWRRSRIKKRLHWLWMNDERIEQRTV